MEAAGARRTGKKRKAKAKVAANAAAKEVIVEVSTGPKPKAASVTAQSKAAKKAASAEQTVATAPAVIKADVQPTAAQGETVSTGKKSKKKRKKKKSQAAAANGDQSATASAPTESTTPQPTATTVKTSGPTKTKPPEPVAAPAQKRKIGQITTSDAKASTIVTIGNSEKPTVSPKRKIVILNSSAKKVKLNAAATVRSPIKKPTPTPIRKTASLVSAPEPPNKFPAVPMPSLGANVAPKLNATPQPRKEEIKPKELETKQKLVRLHEKKQAPSSGKTLEAQTKTSPVVVATNPLVPPKTVDSPTIIAAKPPADENEKKVAPVEEAVTISEAPSPELPTVATVSTKANEEAVLIDLPTLEDIVPEKATENTELLDLPSLEAIFPTKTTEMPELISLPSTPEGNAVMLASGGGECLDVLETVRAISTPPFLNELQSKDQPGLDFLGEWTDSAPSLQVEPSPLSLLDTYHTSGEVERDSVSESVEEKRESDVDQPQVKREAEEPIEILTEDESDAHEPSDTKSDIVLPSEVSILLLDAKLQDQRSENQDEKERILKAQQYATQLKTVEDNSLLQSALTTKQETQMVHAWGPSFGRIQVTSPNEATSSDILSTTPLSSWFLSKGAANFIKRVVSPARYPRKSRSPEKRVRSSSAPVHQLPVQEEADEEDLTESKRNEFLESLALQPAWRSWFTKAHLEGVLDPPLAHVPESVQNHFNAIEDPSEETQGEGLCDSDKIEPKPTIETLEEDIRREKARGKAFDQELLLMLQGRTLSGKDFAAAYAGLLPTATTPT